MTIKASRVSSKCDARGYAMYVCICSRTHTCIDTGVRIVVDGIDMIRTRARVCVCARECGGLLCFCAWVCMCASQIVVTMVKKRMRALVQLKVVLSNPLSLQCNVMCLIHIVINCEGHGHGGLYLFAYIRRPGETPAHPPRPAPVCSASGDPSRSGRAS